MSAPSMPRTRLFTAHPSKRSALLSFTLLLVLGFVALIGGCEVSGDEYEDEAGYDDRNEGNNYYNGNNTIGNNTTSVPPPPEKELLLQTPAASLDYVFVPSTGLDSVARINAKTLEIISIPVGDQPSLVRAHPENNSVVVLNLGSDDLTVIHTEEDGDPLTHRLKIEPHLNQMTLSPKGDYALAYFDQSIAEDSDAIGNFQVLSLARLSRGSEAAETFAVSFHVVAVQFDDLGEKAFVITDDYLHVLNLSELIADPSSYDPGARIALGKDLGGGVIDREVAVTADGAFALVRSAAHANLRIIDVAAKSFIDIELPGTASDLDLFPSGDGALVVMREAGQVALLALPLAFSSPESLNFIPVPESISAGQALISEDGSRAVLFSTSSEQATLGALDLTDGTLTPHRLGSGKQIEGASMGPKGDWIYVQHKGNSSSADPVKRSEGFSILNYFEVDGETTSRDMFFQTDAPAESVLFATQQDLFVLAPGANQLLQVNLRTLEHSTETLGSPPLLLGALPTADRAYAVQDHPTGRITFVDIVTGHIQTVTGFELNSRTR